MTCAEAADRIVERLYGELAEEERPLLEGHLASCERCRLEVEGLDRTRRTARLLLDGPLMEPAPARVRRDVLQAAERAVRQRAAAPAAPAPPAGDALRGLWSWLRRPWFLPAFAAASLLAIFFIARPVLIDGPGRLLDQPSAPAVAVSTEARPAPASPAPPVVLERADEGNTLRPAHLQQPERRIRLSAPAEPAALADEPAVEPPAAPAAASRRTRSAPLARAKRSQAVVAEARGPATAGAKGFAAPPPARPADAEREVVVERARVAAAASARAEADSTGYALPAPANALHQAGPDGQAARPAPVGLGRDLALRISDQPRKSAPATPAAEAPVAQTISREAGAGGRAAPAEPLAALMEKADRLFNERRWQEAADAYRDLLRRFASHPRAAEWQRRRAISVESLRR